MALPEDASTRPSGLVLKPSLGEGLKQGKKQPGVLFKILKKEGQRRWGVSAKTQGKHRGFERLLVSKRSAGRPGHHLKITAVPQLTSCFVRRDWTRFP